MNPPGPPAPCDALLFTPSRRSLIPVAPSQPRTGGAAVYRGPVVAQQVDTRRVEREFTRHIVAESVADPMEQAAYPDFEHEPIPLEPWLRDPAFLGLRHFSADQLDALRHAERIYLPPTYEALGWPDVRMVFQLNLAWGKGSGKDFISRVLLSRGVYLLMCLASPQAYFGFPGSETIYFTNIATAAPQAKTIFFDPWVRMLSGSPWFRQVMDPKAVEIDFDKGLKAVSGHSKSESQEGKNLIMGVADEISGFKTAAELAVRSRLQDREPEMSAEGIVKTLRSSIRSRFPHSGKLILLSFTRFKNDMIDQSVKRAEADIERRGAASTQYASRRATWQVNPLRSRSDFDEDYEEDPLDAKCRYECQPEASPNRYFKNLVAVRRALGAPLIGELDKLPAEERVTIEYEYGPDPDDPELPDGWQVRFDFSGMKQHRIPLALHLDLGISQDLAGVGATHVEGWKDHVEVHRDEHGYETRNVTKRPQLVTDFVIVFEQQSGDPVRDIPGSDIQIRWVRQLIFKLRSEGWVIGMFTADGYQSTDTLQLLERHGIRTDKFSLDRNTEGYDTLKSVVYSGDVTAPFDPLLYSEIESLVKISDTKIDHQAGMSKDMADAWAGSVHGALVLFEEGVGGGQTDPDDMWAGGSLDEQRRATGPDPSPGPLVDRARQRRYGADGDLSDPHWSGGGIPWGPTRSD